MGAEVGATTSTFPYSEQMRSYLIATGRAPVARAADEAAARGFLAADEGAEYDEVINIVCAIHNLCRICLTWSL
jgi:homoaconitase